MTAPQQFSPDGQWWWDGTQWVPASQAPQGSQPVNLDKPQQPQANPGAWPPVGDPNAPAAPQAAAPPYGQAYGQPQVNYGYPTQPLYGAPQPQGTDGKAIGSLVSSLLGVFCGVGLIVGVILGHVSRSEAKKEGRPGSGLALAGILIGYIFGAFWIIGITFVATHVDDVKNTFDTSIELQSAADAEHSYHSSTGSYTSDLRALRSYGYTNLNSTTDIKVVSATASTFCLKGKVFGEDQYISEHDDRPTSTPCG